MNIQDLINLTNNRLSYIQQQKQVAVAQGDVAQLQKLSDEEATTLVTLTRLMSLAA